MIFRRLRNNQSWKNEISRRLVDHLPQGLVLGLCLTLIFLVVTLSRPKSSSNSIRTPSIDPPTTISSQPIVTVTSQPTTDGHTDSLPVLTYYYIWFDTQSWDRAKKDYPLLGPIVVIILTSCVNIFDGQRMPVSMVLS